jgi:hypothetical protein
MPTGKKERRKGRIAAQAGPPAKRRRRQGQDSDPPRLEEISRSLEDPDEFQLPNRWLREWLWLVLLGAGIAVGFGAVKVEEPAGAVARVPITTSA